MKRDPSETQDSVCNAFVNAVKFKLRRDRLRQRDLADLMGVGDPSLSIMLRNDHISTKNMVKIADALNLDVRLSLVERKDRRIPVEDESGLGREVSLG